MLRVQFTPTSQKRRCVVARPERTQHPWRVARA